MKASQTVFLTLDRKRAVPAGDKEAQFKLVHEGQEIDQSKAEQYEGAVELIGGKKAATKGGGVEDRDPEPKKARKH
jgi:hypothetical protein